MASPWTSIALLLFFAGVYAGPVAVEPENGIAEKSESPYDDLKNHTTAVVEFVLQNLHGLKNYQERERLERLVTRFKALVDQLGSHQLQNNINYQPENDAQETADIKYPFSRNQLSQNVMLKEKQLEKMQPHRGRLSITLLPRGEEPSRKLQLSKLAESTTPTAAAAAVMTTQHQILTSLQPQQLAVPKADTDRTTSVGVKHDTAEKSESNESDDDEEANDNDDDELVEELHHTNQPINLEHKISDHPVPDLDDDQLIELNDKRYNPSSDSKVGKADATSGGLAKAWDSTITETTQQLIDDNEEDEDDDEDDDDDIDFIDPTDHDSLDDDVKLLNKVIGNLRQVKEVLRRMHVGEQNLR